MNELTACGIALLKCTFAGHKFSMALNIENLYNCLLRGGGACRCRLYYYQRSQYNQFQLLKSSANEVKRSNSFFE